jgi:hypothetical protein
MSQQDQDNRNRKPVGTGSAPSKSVDGAPFPHLDFPEEAREERNADYVPRTPEGPRRGPLGPTKRRTRPEEQSAEDHKG